MVNSRRKHDIRLRKRREEEGEDDEGSNVPAVEDDSMSEESAISDGDEDGDGDVSEVSVVEAGNTAKSTQESRTSSHTPLENGGPGNSVAGVGDSAKGTINNDTVAMINGLQVTSDESEDKGTNFEDLTEPTEGIAYQPQDKQEATGQPISFAEQRRQEHEEYKKRRDADPAFVPNRGGFFMHDQRNSNGDQSGSRPFGGKVRGKGRAGFVGPVGQSRAAPSSLADTPWAHDLHDTMTEPDHSGPSSSKQPAVRPPQTQHLNRTLSKTVRVGSINIRVLLPGMMNPVLFSAIPTNQHTRLPNHRPPLRRDKPVRVSLPNAQVRYIFPSVERSFIFIPRAMRPNQQGFGRLRGRNSFSGGLGAFSSRRTSVYAVSNYTPSLAHSRRSSIARDHAHDGFTLPATGAIQRPVGASFEPGKPVVRLPPSLAQPPEQEPEEPTLRENRTEVLPMHQPRPQKTVIVADIEAPTFNAPPQQQQQPFHQQIPAQVTNTLYPSDGAMYSHQSHPSHPSQVGTPLAQIPEQAIHAQPFQPYGYPPAPGYYYPPYPPPILYYPRMDPSGPTGPPAAAPVFIPGQPYPYAMPFMQPPPPAMEPTTQAGTVAHESNGMVYYYDSSQVPTETSAAPSYPPAGYSAPIPGGAHVANGVVTPPAPFVPPPSSTPYAAPQ